MTNKLTEDERRQRFIRKMKHREWRPAYASHRHSDPERLANRARLHANLGKMIGGNPAPSIRNKQASATAPRMNRPAVTLPRLKFLQTVR